MPQYIDGFVIPIAKRKLPAYKRLAALGSKVWMEHGALAYFECVGEQMEPGFGLPFPKLCKCKKDETVVFAWIVYKSRAHRDRVNKKVMADPRMANACDPKNPPFDIKRMACGGFEVMVKG